ncbi:hypothetical protein A2Y83_02200 [Candidatus Falkowbacteria bacterium RBG_13_39_14]|uniref:AbiEi antitoxin C-terminal domain-containing protein n=1 Tax=Candidatus Falkowbacteria bacterium RBG_13_39_14 TaxID=1797985 RepID=A0A1F5S1B6_9BACT|nr:MAG: hypothetical protein A2Y83_02200 [Candidatus Falkowbacteria bacterium RBG_13_39_14]
MRNKVKKEKLSENVLSLVKDLPFFDIAYLKNILKNEHYLKILLHRYSKNGDIIRLKKGIYTTKRYAEGIKNKGSYSNYLEFLASAIYPPAYLSLEYVLSENNLLTEMPENFTLITRNKTANFRNNFGNFIYHNVKESLFTGFSAMKHNEFIIYKATKAKALFDFIYLRKNIITDRNSFEELRLNTIILTSSDKKKLLEYAFADGSGRMMKILKYI